MPDTEHPPGSYQEHASDSHVLELLRNRFQSKPTFLRAAFREVDTDGSSTITAEEVSAALRMLHIDVSLATAQRLTRLVDKNKDGVISYSEFVKAFEADAGLNTPPLARLLVPPKAV
jgi:Ca2+-binding EF-hand superfamily protein